MWRLLRKGTKRMFLWKLCLDPEKLLRHCMNERVSSLLRTSSHRRFRNLLRSSYQPNQLAPRTYLPRCTKTQHKHPRMFRELPCQMSTGSELIGLIATSQEIT